jgi:sirohydrochlorin cobaltochelatase
VKRNIVKRKKGVLVIAHGSRNEEWVKQIDQTVSSVKLDLPVRIGYLELVEGRSITDGIRYFEKMGVEEVIVLPLFISMASTHLHEIQYALGLIPTLHIESSLEKIHPRAKITWCSPLENHWIVTEILTARVKNLSQNAQEESLLVVGHGSKEAGFHEKWNHLLKSTTHKLQQRFGFQAASYATMRPDTVSLQAKLLSRKSQLIVVPFFISEGYFTKVVLPERLGDIPHHYDGRTCLPHPMISVWIEQSIKSILTPVPR